MTDASGTQAGETTSEGKDTPAPKPGAGGLPASPLAERPVPGRATVDTSDMLATPGVVVPKEEAGTTAEAPVPAPAAPAADPGPQPAVPRPGPATTGTALALRPQDAARRAVVTGAAGGIGKRLVAGLAAAGWQVAAVDISREGLAPVSDAAIRLAADVRDEYEVSAAIRRLDWDGIDLLVNAAGPPGPKRGPIEELSLADWREVIDSHLTGTFLMTRATVPLLRARKGSVVNIASTRAFMSESDSEAYAAAKGGIVALTHALAASLGPDVRANAVAPGWIVGDGWDDLTSEDHKQHLVGRAGTPDDVLGAVMWLAGAGFVTGQVVTVDGGMTKKMIYAE